MFANKLFIKNPLEKVLFLGIIIRIIVFIFIDPSGNDRHIQVINYFCLNHKLPLSSELGSSFHPPLYYLLASLFGFFGSDKFIQFFSLLLSIVTLVIFYVLIKNLRFMSSLKIKFLSLLLPSLLPSLIMTSSYISNDALSFFEGALIFLQMYFILNNPSYLNQIILAIYLGFGLLTKATFLPFLAPIFFFIFIVNLKNKILLKKIVFRIFFLSLIILFLGSYKYVENTINYNRPFVHNLDFKHVWADMQRPTYQDLISFINPNILILVKDPIVADTNKHSVMLMLYGTFWYQFIPESNFMGNLTIFKYLGSLIYLFAFLPTFLMLIGFLRILYFSRYLINFKNLAIDKFNSLVYYLSILFIFLINLIMVVYIGIKYDVWSCFQSRLLYASFFAFIIFFYQGFEYIKTKLYSYRSIFYYVFFILNLFFILYFASEIFGQIFYKYFKIPKFML